MTKLADEVFTLVQRHREELRSLIRTEADKDAFQDTVLWMAEHARTCNDFVRQFRMRFRFIKIENCAPHVRLAFDVPDTSEPYSETVSDETDEQVLNDIRNAILEEEKTAKTRV